MVNDGGQLYTIEGFTAGIIMVFTVFLVMSSTTVYTPGDSHISDLQLEQLGHDVLWTMNIPPAPQTESPLQQYIEQNNTAGFDTAFRNGINNMTGSQKDALYYTASVTCIDPSSIIVQTPFSYSRNLTGGEHAVRVTQWVLVQQNCPINSLGSPGPHAMLVEVLLWRE